MFCRRFTALRLSSMFNSSVLQMGGAIPYWTELLYIRFSVQSSMDGDALSWKLGEFATVNKEWRDFKRGLEEVEKVEEGPQRGLEDTRVNGWLMGVLENLKSWTWIWTLSHKLVMLNESGSMILHREISFPMFNICDHFVATFNSTWFFLH